MTLFSKFVVSGLLFLSQPIALEAFIPSKTSSTATATTTTTTLYATTSTLNATETSRATSKRRDPFLNSFLEDGTLGGSGASRFVRYDRAKDKERGLTDTSTDDFINKYNYEGLGRKPTGGNPRNRDGTVKIESSVDASSFASSKFERYDKKKFGNLVLGDNNNYKKNDDFVNKKDPTQSSIHTDTFETISSSPSSSSSYPQHMKKRSGSSPGSSSSGSTLNVEGVEFKRYNPKEDKSLFTSSSNNNSNNNQFVQDPRQAATARQAPPTAPSPNASRVRRERQESVSFPRATSRIGAPQTTRFPSSTTIVNSMPQEWVNEIEQKNTNGQENWLQQREARGGQESWQQPAMPHVPLENVYKAPPRMVSEDTQVRPGRFVTRSGADVSQHITESKGPESVVGTAFSVPERKPVRPETRTSPVSVRPSSSTSARKPVMPQPSPTLRRPYTKPQATTPTVSAKTNYRRPPTTTSTTTRSNSATTTTTTRNPVTISSSSGKTVYTSSPPPQQQQRQQSVRPSRQPVRPESRASTVAPRQSQRQPPAPELSDVDARVLREMLQSEQFDYQTEASMRDMLERGVVGTERTTTVRTPTPPRRNHVMPQEARRTPVMPTPRASVSATSPTTTALPRRRRRPKTTEEEQEDQVRRTRQQVQAQKNREALLQNYHSISDEEMILYGMKVSGNQQVPPEFKTLPPPPKYGWGEYGIEDGFMDNYPEYHSFHAQQEQKQASKLKETPKATSATTAVQEKNDSKNQNKDPREGSYEGNEWVDLGDPRSPGFKGFSDSAFKPMGGDMGGSSSSSSVGSSLEQWWKRNDWDSSQEVVITDYAGDDYTSGSIQPQRPEPKTEEPKNNHNGDSGIPKPKAPGFVGFSNVDWSQR